MSADFSVSSVHHLCHLCFKTFRCLAGLTGLPFTLSLNTGKGTAENESSTLQKPDQKRNDRQNPGDGNDRWA